MTVISQVTKYALTDTGNFIRHLLIYFKVFLFCAVIFKNTFFFWLSSRKCTHITHFGDFCSLDTFLAVGCKVCVSKSRRFDHTGK